MIKTILYTKKADGDFPILRLLYHNYRLRYGKSEEELNDMFILIEN